MARQYLKHDLLSSSKKCPRCKEEKLKEEFGPCNSKRQSPDGLQGYCKICMRQAAAISRERKYADKDPRHFEVNEGECAICFNVKRLYVDHDHRCCDEAYSCGKCVRGLICRECNVGLGMLKDDAATLMRAFSYLANWEMSRV